MKLFPLLLSVALTYPDFSVKAAFISKNANGWSIQKKARFYPNLVKSAIVDADFERIDSNDENDNSKSMSQDADSSDIFGKSILDMTIRDNNETFPFMDSDSQNAIFCRLAVTSNLDEELGGTYAIGIPEENGVLMIVERGGEELEYIDPDVSENVELLEIMAGALQKYLSPDLQLQRTPRILTIAGDLDQYTNKLPDNLVSEDMTFENLMDEPDGDLDQIDDFFKEQFGKEQYNEFIKEFEQNQSDPEFLAFAKFFEEGLEGGVDEAPSTPKEFEQAVRDLGLDLQNDGVGLKLVGFSVKQPDHPKTAPFVYSLVKPVKPLTVVGRLRKNAEDNSVIFQLLSPDEEQVIVPKLEQICKKEIESLGIDLDSSNR